MSVPEIEPMTTSIEDRFRALWRRSDELFGLLDAEAMSERPINLRHPVIFYVGHLPAFAWNQVCRGLLGRASFNEGFDHLFERGIDPVGVDAHQDATSWPPMADVEAYRDRVREALISCVPEVASRADDDPLAARGRIFEVAIEHELMHQETLQYMFQQLPAERKRRPAGMPPYRFDGAAPPGEVEVRGGPVVLGARFDELPFGWDNEFPEQVVQVGDLVMDRTPVRTSEYLEFLADDGYRRPELWTDDDWRWRERIGLEQPVFWSSEGDRRFHHTMFDRLELERVRDWPVYASLAEARAYARWRGRRLPTEAEVARAAYTTPGGSIRSFPWGEDAPSPAHGNFDFAHWAPTPVGAFPRGDSAWGVAELVGNGWEWTSSVFAPFPGFEPTISSYPGYSADFFDDRHYVMLGASWATPAQLIRRSFRNWFQDRYPYMFAKFRTVRAA